MVEICGDIQEYSIKPDEVNILLRISQDLK
jgi:hypothetical protein